MKTTYSELQHYDFSIFRKALAKADRLLTGLLRQNEEQAVESNIRDEKNLSAQKKISVGVDDYVDAIERLAKLRTGFFN